MNKAILASLALALAAGPGASADLPAEADAGVRPFAAHFIAEWKGIGVATSDLDLRRDVAPDQWVYTWRISARGIFRIVYSDDVVQTSWFDLAAAHVRTRRYEAREGSQEVHLDFDWDAHRARGASEGKPLDLVLQDNTQDVLSIQVEVMQDLRNGTLPAQKRVAQGGIGTLPGYDLKLFPGANLALANLEWSLASATRLPRMILFYDGGVVWTAGQDGVGWKNDLGLGLRFQADGGTFLRLDFARAVSDPNE
jgi:hypothetical protein